MSEPVSFSDLPALAQHLRDELENKKFILLYAYNGVGKTRLSTAFKDAGKQEVKRPFRAGDRAGQPLTITEVKTDTLYFNAFTEDLFTWANDNELVLKINADSAFFAGLESMEMDVKIGKLLERYADFNFYIDYEKWHVMFFRDRELNGDPIPIKISRGEENIFIWCFFLAIAQLALDDNGDGPYNWVKYIYIDDPISSLDEHNAIVFANHLVQIYKEASRKIETIISTHHTLFFNVLHYELKNHFRGNAAQHVLSRDRHSSGYLLTQQNSDTPSFHHVAALVELYKASQSETIHTYHFNMLRVILEKTALFHGYGHFGKCLKKNDSDADGILHQRFVDLLSHGKYSIFEPVEMGNDTKEYFREILNSFLEDYPFNPALFPEAEKATTT